MTTKEAIEIGKADDVLRQAKKLVEQAYDLICKSPTASKHLKFDCTIGWKPATWNKLDNEFAVENPLITETHHLRAFYYFGLNCGSKISLDGMSQSSEG